MRKVGLFILVTSSSIPPLVLSLSNGWHWFLVCFFACRCRFNLWMISPTSNGRFGSPLEGHMRPFGLSFTFGLPPSVWGSIGESPKPWWRVEGHLWRCQAGRPKSGRPAWQGRVGDLPGRVIPSELRIGWSKSPFWSSRQALRHGAVKYVIWGNFVPCPSVICTEMSKWTFSCMASTATSPVMVFVHHFTYIPCKTWWDTKLMELISLNRTLYQNFFKFPH